MLFRKKKQSPEIIVNGISYASEAEMPEDIGREWHRCGAEMDNHGAELRNAKRIFFDVTRAENSSERSCRVETHPRTVKQRIGPLGVAFFAYVVVVAGLSLLGIGWVGPFTIVPFDELSFFALFLALYSPMFLLFFTKARRSPELARKKTLSRYTHLIVAALGWAVVCHGAVFGGLPKALHSVADKENDVIVATVTATYDFTSRYRRCKPSIELDAMYFPDTICVNREFFDHVRVHDRVKIVGSKSRFAMEPVRVEMIKK
jgi:hypothetical protein